MKAAPAYRKKFLLLVLVTLIFSSGCGVYFNTFFNAKKYFGSAEKARKRSPSGNAGGGDYQKAIEKALKVVENNPNSKYYDDAVYILAVSYFHTRQFSRSERRFREMLANYPDSKNTRESGLYLAKAKLELGDIEDAMALFSEIFEADYDKDFKAEAAMALGRYHFNAKEYESSRRYFLAVRDSLGENVQKLESQIYVADGYYDLFKFRDALGAYLQVLGMEPDKGQTYHAKFRSALCSYHLQRIVDGLAYLDELIEDELYYDSLGTLRLTVARGYELDDDLLQAEASYSEVATTTENQRLASRAFYRLGLIYQFDYDQLGEAKEYYDKAVQANRSSEESKDALQRSSDIGKLEQYARAELDSTATEGAIDDAAYTQFMLSELYWLSLNKPDSAIIEMQYLVDSFPTSFYAPNGRIALAEMIRVELGDNETADSLLRSVLTDYPKSDYVPEALTALGLGGTAADTGYAEIFIDRGEDFVEADVYDSARVNYQYVVDNFPDSKYHLLAQFTLLWLTEKYEPPGDSSLALAYQEFADSFPGSDFSYAALERLGQAARRPQRPAPTAAEDQLAETGPDRDEPPGSVQDEAIPGAQEYVDPLVSLYYLPSGDSLVLLKADPIEVVEEFEYPVEVASQAPTDSKLYFQILVDFSGKVVDYKLHIASGIDEIDARARLAVGSMTFDALEVSNKIVSSGSAESDDGRGHWFVYEYRVVKPKHLR